MKDFKQIFRNIFEKISENRGTNSFAQCGEDLLVVDILKRLKIQLPFYVDIGAYDPKKLSNTYLLYRNGGRGICVDANPVLCKKIKKVRSRDNVLNVGVVGKISHKKELDFFLMHPPKLSSFSKSLIETYDPKGVNLVKKIKVEIKQINDILKLAKKNIDFLSIDVEGMDLELLTKINFKKFKPKIICVESSVIGTDKIQKFVYRKGYFLCAKTPLNVIFVDNKYVKEFV
jgi:FkbM family methyltransferase